jgi:hypothetical protein
VPGIPNFLKNLFDKHGVSPATQAYVQSTVASDIQKPDKPMQENEAEYRMGIDGHLLVDQNLERIGNSIIEQAEALHIRPMDAYTLQVLISHLIRGSFNTVEDAEIGALQSEILIDRIKANLPDEAYEEGVSNLFNAFNLIIRNAFNDSIGGRKAKLTKVSTRAYEITAREQKPQKETPIP